jgi:plasmid stability protein
MPSLTLKNVPEDLHQRLKEQAERHRRSMNQEAIWILEQALSPTRRDAEEVIAKAEVLNQDIDKEFDASLVEKNKRREGLQ